MIKLSISLLLFIILNSVFAQDNSNPDLALADKILYSHPDSARTIYFDFIDLEEAQNSELSEIYRKIGISFDLQSQFDSSLYYLKQGLKIAKEVGDIALIAKTLNSIGVIHFNMSNYPEAFEYYQLTLKEAELLKDTLLMAKSLSNIGHVYFYQNELELARDLYNQALEYGRIIKDPDIISAQYQNIGNVDYTERNLEKAISDYLKSLEIDEKNGQNYRAAYTLTGLAMISKEVSDYEGALKYFNKALDIRRAMNDEVGICNVYVNIADTYIQIKKYQKAEDFADKALKLSLDIKNYEAITMARAKMAEIFKLQGNYKMATAFYEQYIQERDSLYSLENKEKIQSLEKKYESEKKSLEIAMLKKDKAIHEEAIVIKNQQIYLLTAGIFGAFIIAFIGFRSFNNRKKAIELLEIRNNLIEEKQSLLESHNKEIKDSIAYAKTIQKSLLPPDFLVKSYFKDAFIFYKAKDIVSGDFYWTEKIGDLKLIAVIDCTGHGVPGAMISVIAHSILNRVAREFKFIDPGLFLDKLNQLFLAELDTENTLLNDGMDISLAIHDEKNRMIKMAGANQRAYFYTKGELEVIRFNRQPIGRHGKHENFTSYERKFDADDELFLFTDGFADQFGGPKGKKYYYKHFRNFIASIAENSTYEQKNKIKEEFNRYSKGYEQLDDILVMGIKA